MKFTLTKRCPSCRRTQGLHRIRRSFALRLLVIPVQTRNYYCPYCDKRFILFGNNEAHKAVEMPTKQP